TQSSFSVDPHMKKKKWEREREKAVERERERERDEESDCQELEVDMEGEGEEESECKEDKVEIDKASDLSLEEELFLFNLREVGLYKSGDQETGKCKTVPISVKFHIAKPSVSTDLIRRNHQNKCGYKLSKKAQAALIKKNPATKVDRTVKSKTFQTILDTITGCTEVVLKGQFEQELDRLWGIGTDAHERLVTYLWAMMMHYRFKADPTEDWQSCLLRPITGRDWFNLSGTMPPVTDVVEDLAGVPEAQTTALSTAPVTDIEVLAAPTAPTSTVMDIMRAALPDATMPIQPIQHVQPTEWGVDGERKREREVEGGDVSMGGYGESEGLPTASAPYHHGHQQSGARGNVFFVPAATAPVTKSSFDTIYLALPESRRWTSHTEAQDLTERRRRKILELKAVYHRITEMAKIIQTLNQKRVTDVEREDLVTRFMQLLRDPEFESDGMPQVVRDTRLVQTTKPRSGFRSPVQPDKKRGTDHDRPHTTDPNPNSHSSYVSGHGHVSSKSVAPDCVRTEQERETEAVPDVPPYNPTLFGSAEYVDSLDTDVPMEPTTPCTDTAHYLASTLQGMRVSVTDKDDESRPATPIVQAKALQALSGGNVTVTEVAPPLHPSMWDAHMDMLMREKVEKRDAQEKRERERERDAQEKRERERFVRERERVEQSDEDSAEDVVVGVGTTDTSLEEPFEVEREEGEGEMDTPESAASTTHCLLVPDYGTDPMPHQPLGYQNQYTGNGGRRPAAFLTHSNPVYTGDKEEKGD
ncbi:hypothetical protein KIPB_002683, partial [Kipferlia bialata]